MAERKGQKPLIPLSHSFISSSSSSAPSPSASSSSSSHIDQNKDDTTSHSSLMSARSSSEDGYFENLSSSRRSFLGASSSVSEQLGQALMSDPKYNPSSYHHNRKRRRNQRSDVKEEREESEDFSIMGPFSLPISCRGYSANVTRDDSKVKLLDAGRHLMIWRPYGAHISPSDSTPTTPTEGDVTLDRFDVRLLVEDLNPLMKPKPVVSIATGDGKRQSVIYVKKEDIEMEKMCDEERYKDYDEELESMEGDEFMYFLEEKWKKDRIKMRRELNGEPVEDSDSDGDDAEGAEGGGGGGKIRNMEFAPPSDVYEIGMEEEKEEDKQEAKSEAEAKEEKKEEEKEEKEPKLDTKWDPIWLSLQNLLPAGEQIPDHLQTATSAADEKTLQCLMQTVRFVISVVTGNHPKYNVQKGTTQEDVEKELKKRIEYFTPVFDFMSAERNPALYVLYRYMLDAYKRKLDGGEAIGTKEMEKEEEEQQQQQPKEEEEKESKGIQPEVVSPVAAALPTTALLAASLPSISPPFVPISYPIYPPPPPPDVLAVMTKLIDQIVKNGIEFEKRVLEKQPSSSSSSSGESKFSFLHPWNPHHQYYVCARDASLSIAAQTQLASSPPTATPSPPLLPSSSPPLSEQISVQQPVIISAPVEPEKPPVLTKEELQAERMRRARELMSKQKLEEEQQAIKARSPSPPAPPSQPSSEVQKPSISASSSAVQRKRSRSRSRSQSRTKSRSRSRSRSPSSSSRSSRRRSPSPSSRRRSSHHHRHRSRSRDRSRSRSSDSHSSSYSKRRRRKSRSRSRSGSRSRSRDRSSSSRRYRR